MKYALLFAALTGATAISDSAKADAIQILDDHSTECIQRAMNAVEMPNARLNYPSYGQTRHSSLIDENITANLTIDTSLFNPDRSGSVVPDITVSVIADVTHDIQQDYDYRHRRSITITFNESGDLTRVIEGRLSSDWDALPYEYRNGETPNLSGAQLSAIYQWVESASEAAAFMFAFCHSEQVYTPRDGEMVSPPAFSVLNAM